MGDLLASVWQHTAQMHLADRLWTGEKRAEGMFGEGTSFPLPEQEQLNQYADAFLGLARLFQEMPCQKERLSDDDMERLFAEVRQLACSRCGGEGQCWRSGYHQLCRMLYEMLMQLETEGCLSREMIQEVEGQCIHPQQMVSALQAGYAQARNGLLWSNRMMEQRMAAGEQIYQTARLLQRAAQSFSGAPAREQRIGKRLKKELRYLGIELLHIRVFVCEDGRTEIYLSLRSGKRTCVSSKTVAEILSECCREKMRPVWNCRAAVGQEASSFHFVPDTRYQIFCGIARITKAGELVSGDNYAFLQKDTGKVVMSLADGMGSGVGACRESEKVIELLEQFLDAGFPQETAVRMINSCMLLQNYQQMYSTIDLSMVDLYHAGCDMIKSGAAATFIKQGNEIEVIHSSAFPAGVMQQSDYESMHRQLASGSSVIMMTDGVLEALPEENREQKMAELIGRCESRNAREYAQRMMERVYLMQKLEARDDMTILVGTIWEKQE